MTQWRFSGFFVVLLGVLLAPVAGASSASKAEIFLEHYMQALKARHPDFGSGRGAAAKWAAAPAGFNTELVGSYRPDSVDMFTDLYVSGDYVYLGNAFDGLRVIDAANPASPREVGSFPAKGSGVFKLDPVTGASQALGNRVGMWEENMAFPAALAFDAVHGRLFVADYGTLSLQGLGAAEERMGALWQLDVQSGALELVLKGDPLLHPLDMAIDASGALIVANAAGSPFFSSQESSILKIDPASGAATLLLKEPSLSNPYGVAVDSAGAIFIANMFHFDSSNGNFEFGKLVKLDPESGAVTTVVEADVESPDPDFLFLGDIAIDSSGAVLALSLSSWGLEPKVLRIDPAGGQVEVLYAGGPLTTPVKLALDADGAILIADTNADPAGLGISTGAIFRLAPGSGALETLATGAGVRAPFGLAPGPDGALLWSDIDQLVRIADVKVAGDLAIVSNETPSFPDFLNAGMGGIQILDIADPTRPRELAKYARELPAGVHNTFIAGELAYLVSNSSGLQILDISAPGAPFKIGEWALPPSEENPFPALHDLSVHGDRAYLAYLDSGLRILDISDPRNPVQIGVYTYPDAFTHSAEYAGYGDFVFITDEMPGGFMRVVDISDLAHPVEVGHYQSSSRIVATSRELSIHNILVRDDLIYVGNYQDGFRAVDVSDPKNPLEVGSYLLSESYSADLWGLFNGAWTSFPANGLVYVSDVEFGLFILDFKRPLHLVREIETHPSLLHAGVETDVIIRARIQRLGKGGDVAVSADLSALGGAAAAPMRDDGQGMDERAGDGIFTAWGRLVPPQAIAGKAVLQVSTRESGGQGTFARRAIPLYPAENSWIYQDGLAPGWAVDARDIETIELQQEEEVYQGAAAAAFRTRPHGKPVDHFQLSFVAPAPIDTLGLTSLRFAFHPGTTKRSRLVSGNIDLSVLRINVTSSSPLHLIPPYCKESVLKGLCVIDPKLKEWQEVEVPLEMLNPRGAISEIRFWGDMEGTFYIDNLGLVARSGPLPITAVLEEQLAAGPQDFALEQNFPNPFNSSTLIRFTLAAPQKVELALYNLAGQRLATLAEGAREAGSHQVRWDARDFASGVYLYRLQAGLRVLSRKLVLLR